MEILIVELVCAAEGRERGIGSDERAIHKLKVRPITDVWRTKILMAQ
jgi:hypothetical protein